MHTCGMVRETVLVGLQRPRPVPSVSRLGHGTPRLKRPGPVPTVSSSCLQILNVSRNRLGGATTPEIGLAFNAVGIHRASACETMVVYELMSTWEDKAACLGRLDTDMHTMLV